MTGHYIISLSDQMFFNIRNWPYNANMLSSVSVLLGYSELSTAQLQAIDAFHFQLQQLLFKFQ